MEVLQDMEPKRVFHYFEQICSMPHGSGNTRRISDWLVQFATEHKLAYQQDTLGNVIIRKPATAGYEDHDAVMLQGHMDMVAVKEADCPKNLETEGLDLEITGDDLHAVGTSLGGDDGIAIAYALAILEADDIPHPELEVVITVDEEVGMDGATGIDLTGCRARKLLNLDSEEEGILTVSCAGGVRIKSMFPLERTETEGEMLQIRVSGLKGGHSGQEINKGRANANILLGQILKELAGRVPYRILAVSGGTRDNVIPSEAAAQIVVQDETVAAGMETMLREQQSAIAKRYRDAENPVVLELLRQGRGTYSAWTSECAEKMIQYLTTQPNGVRSMSKQIEGLVQTSLNLGVIATEDTFFTGDQGLRSSVQSELDALAEQVERITGVLGGKTARRGAYPPWEYREDSELRDVMIASYQELFGQKPIVEAIHAGLECGILAAKLPGLDCVSIGPMMHDIHSTSEGLSITSTQRCFRYVLDILGRL